VIEYDEWGNPNDRETFERMLAYSPYDNVIEAAYPNLLVTGGLNDPRVAYWEPAKWIARIRERQTGDGIVLLKTELGAGHGGPSGRYDSIREMALEYAFLIERCGATF
jgi:oligopeptidase B